MERGHRVFFYVINGLGLGHLTRCMAIARELVKIKNVNPIFLTSSEAPQLIYKEGFPYFKMPSKNSASSSGMKKHELQQAYQTTVQNLLAIYRPALLVVDTFPLGLLRELFGILQPENNIPKVLIQRKVKASRMTESRIRQQGFYNHIIVPHRETEGPFYLRDEIKKTFTGAILIRNKRELFTKNRSRDILFAGKNDNNNLNVYINLGGGGDQDLESGLGVISKLANLLPNLNFFIPKPPLIKKMKSFKEKNIFLFEYYPVLEILPAFDMAISASGYNSYHELLYANIPTIFFSQERGYDDQLARAKEGFEKGICRFVDSLKETNELKNILSQLQDRKNRTKLINRIKKEKIENGAILAAKTLADYL